MSDPGIHFNYDFPSELIATEPMEPRSQARMLVYSRSTGRLRDCVFADLPEFLRPGDRLVVNETRILPARFLGRRKTGGAIEGIYLSSSTDTVNVWLQGRVDTGEVVDLENFGEIRIRSRTEKTAELECEPSRFIDYLKHYGLAPVPLYIRTERKRRAVVERTKNDFADYQTIFSRESDTEIHQLSVASPTASLHFDRMLLDSLSARGIALSKISLAVGTGTFAPLEGNWKEARLHSERVEVSRRTWSEIEETRRSGGRIIAVGTTVVRSLEAAARNSPFQEEFQTDLFVRPPFSFQICDALITNFHWPESSLIILVATFLEALNGKCEGIRSERWRELYTHAIREKYRLFSYGDGMLIL